MTDYLLNNVLELAVQEIDIVGPILLLLLIFLFKLSIRERSIIENLKRLSVETSIDVMSLAQSFILSFVILASRTIPTSEDSPHTLDSLKGILALLVSIVPLLFIVIIVKVSLEEYAKKAKFYPIALGLLVTYPVAFFCLNFSISLLRSLGGD